MIGLLWRIVVGRFTSCRHHWRAGPVTEWQHNVTGHVVYRTAVLQCDHCGDLKKVEV